MIKRGVAKGVNRDKITAAHVIEAADELFPLLGETAELEGYFEAVYLRELHDALSNFSGAERLRVKLAESACFKSKGLYTRAKGINQNLKSCISLLQTELKYYEV
jgi:hypothetical protein